MFFLSLLASSSLSLASTPRVCQEALFATGKQWQTTRHSPLQSIHPAFSKTAEKIYYSYDIIGLEIFIEMSPYGGSHVGANSVRKFYLQFDPSVFFPFSYFRLLFGDKPLNIDLADGGFDAYYQEGTLMDDEIGEYIQFRIPVAADAEPGDLDKSIQLVISRETGMVYGYRPKLRNCVADFALSCYMELRRLANAEAKGWGMWYNSNSGMPVPSFYTWAKRERTAE